MFYNYVLKHNSCFAAIRLKSPSGETGNCYEGGAN